ncbi:MAG TPA: hypothetical protein VM096_11490 [Vicinamibacterales bacterium]|nr:hypothetical protein [Vicinamibacterales bacterium]
MLNRRDMLAAGLLGSLAPEGGVEAQDQSDVILREGLKSLDVSIDEFKNSVEGSLRGNSMNAGGVGLIKNELMRYLKQSGKFPEYCDIGVSIFFDVYDWHVRHQQQIQISRLADQRMAIQFMFTQLILRWENAETYVSTAYDR